MKPFTLYQQLHNLSGDQLGDIIKIITETEQPKAIFLLGASRSSIRTESIFNRCSPSSYKVAEYFLLVLVQKDAAIHLHEITDKIENRCKNIVPATVITLDFDIFENWATIGHAFAKSVLENSVLLYQQPEITMPVAAELNNEELKKLIQGMFDATMNRVNEFIAGAEFYQSREQYKIATFMLHQAIEQALRNMLKIGSGYHANTHNIEKLIRYCSMVDYKITDVFVKNNLSDKRLFKLLQTAYIGVRYSEDYCISFSETASLIEKAKRIKTIFQNEIQKYRFQ